MKIMKKLNNLIINPEKVIREEELITLKGGYDGGCWCVCIAGETTYSISSPDRDCGPLCYEVYGTTSGYCMN